MRYPARAVRPVGLLLNSVRVTSLSTVAPVVRTINATALNHADYQLHFNAKYISMTASKGNCLPPKQVIYTNYTLV